MLEDFTDLFDGWYSLIFQMLIFSNSLFDISKLMLSPLSLEFITRLVDTLINLFFTFFILVNGGFHIT